MRTRTRIFAMILVIAMALSLAACGSSGSSSDGKVNLTFQIWDVAQKAGMEAMCAAYSEKNPNVTIEVQVTSWGEYWTKLEAAATSGKIQSVNNASRPEWKSKVSDELLKIYSGQVELDAGLANMQSILNHLC